MISKGIRGAITVEENSFYKTIDKGMEILKADIEEMKAAGETIMKDWSSNY